MSLSRGGAIKFDGSPFRPGVRAISHRGILISEGNLQKKFALSTSGSTGGGLLRSFRDEKTC